MTCDFVIIEALGLAATTVGASAPVQSAWARLQESLCALLGISHQGMGSGPSVSMFEDKLAQMVSIDLRVYRNALATTGLAVDARKAAAGIGTGIAAAQQSPIRGHINPMDRRQKFVVTG